MSQTPPLTVLALLSACAIAASLPAAAADTLILTEADIANEACRLHLGFEHSGSTLAERERTMANEVESFLSLSEEALSLRASALKFHQELKDKAARGIPRSGEDLRRLSEGATRMLEQRRSLLNMAMIHECWMDQPPAEGPRDAGIRAAGVAMSLSAALLLYDNYLVAIAPFRQDKELRQLLNRADSGFGINGGTLNEIAINFASVENRRRARQAAQWLEKHGDIAPADQVAHYDYLRTSIEQSPSLTLVRRVSPLRDLASNIDFLGSLTVDGVFALKDKTTNLSSLLFGNTVGLVETRHGKLYDRPEITHHIESKLQAGDILLDKTPFRLTDTFIPGHWGHAALWVGSADELRALGIWEHPVVRPFQADIEAGRGVVEALRSGVQTNPIGHFLNVDDMAVLRAATLDRQAKAEAILYALRQVGKPYDFNFDAESTHRIFCSKLVYLAYGNLPWPTSRILGRTTVSPDDIAALSVGDGPLSIELFYHDGAEVAEAPGPIMAGLIKTARAALAQKEKAAQSAE